MYYINCFFIYSFIGFIFEKFIGLIISNSFDSGILYGPITPIYGFGVIIILIISKYLFYHLHMNRWIETIITFLSLIFILTFLELLGGLLIENLFNISTWDYSNLMFNIGKYISLEISIIWGFLALLIIYLIHPKLDKFIIKIPRFVTIIMLIIFIIDLILTLVKIM